MRRLKHSEKNAADRRGAKSSRKAIVLAILLASPCGGCEPPTAAVPDKNPQAAAANGETTHGDTSDDQGARVETWDAQFLGGGKIGYVHTIRAPLSREDGQSLVQIDSHTVINVTRLGRANRQEMRIVSTETDAGRLLGFHSEASLGPTPMVVDGKVAGETLEISQTVNGAVSRHKIPWPADALGFSGPECVLRRHPPRPGERRELRTLAPFLNQLATLAFTAIDYEETVVLDGKRKLLRLDCVTTLPDGAVLKEIDWVTEAGEVLKTEMPGAGQASYRCTEAEAVDDAGQRVDLIEGMTVRVKQPPRLPPDAPRARYVVSLREADPLKQFSQCAYQAVEPLPTPPGAGKPSATGATARLTVWAAGPLKLPAREDLAAEPPPGPEYLAASSMLQTGDPAVRAMADGVTEGERGSAERAVALERTICETIANKNFSQAFATAAEVARSREGDCTEHAVLLAAVARASGIPARVAVGLVYVESLGGFGFHMWTEVHTGGHWLPLDATLGRGGIGVTHIKLADSSLASDTALSIFLPVAEVLGQLEIEFAGE